MRTSTWMVLGSLLSLLIVGAGPARAAVDPAARCIDTKLGAVGKHARFTLRCHAKGLRRGFPADAACLQRADQKLDKLIARADKRGGCPEQADLEALRRMSTALVNRARNGLVTDGTSPSVCTSKKLIAGATRVFKAAKAHGKNARKPDTAKLVKRFQKLDEAFQKGFASAEKKTDCQATGDVAFAAGRFDSGLDALYAAVGLVSFVTVNVPSAAQPPETPGTAGVDANDYPKLVTQFGGTGFDLNQATYTRFGYADGAQPDAILILVPGFEGGAMGFKMMAENLVTRSLEQGFRTEVWAFDRRGNQIEDREGVEIAVEENDAGIALDWFFGSDLGLSLSPELVAGPNRRAIIHDTQADTAFIANWTELVFSQDIDAVVEAALGVAQNGNVFLGGHSAGTGFTARYAATDFDLSGLGPVEAGYAKLRGLVLLEGGGGSTGAPPLSEDALDRIEDRADGGLFFAVRDDAPRCVDGTPCTVATEGVDCAGKGNETCTEETFAYSVIPGLLNPNIFAGSEPGAVQALSTPDEGQLILQVDQGAPGNNAIDVVPELATLGILPQATPEGALGTFLDDDGLIAGFASFVATSVGAPGPVVDGLLTWQDASEGPFAPSVVPDNGPPPTVSFSRWGQEVESTRLDRIGLPFVTPETNFADWYYPSSGLGTTGALGLDSTQLSVGRGRRDIENLTQAANIDIPVISFGATNGGAAVPGSFVGFGESIGTCASPSCDGTARVVDAANPSVAFPTLGGVAGGYEVHLSEGYSHVDIITAEDDTTNQVIGPLIDFLERNAQ